MNRIGIAQVQKKVAEMQKNGWPLRIDFGAYWKITATDGSGVSSPSAATSTELWHWLNAIEDGAKIAKK